MQSVLYPIENRRSIHMLYDDLELKCFSHQHAPHTFLLLFLTFFFFCFYIFVAISQHTFLYVIFLVYKCKSHEFRCGDGLCVDKRHLCDGIGHCPDSSDEYAENCDGRYGQHYGNAFLNVFNNFVFVSFSSND